LGVLVALQLVLLALVWGVGGRWQVGVEESSAVDARQTNRVQSFGMLGFAPATLFNLQA